MGCSQPKDDRRAGRRLQEWRRLGQMRHFLQYKDRWMAAESQWIWMFLTVIWTKITMMVKKSSVF